MRPDNPDNSGDLDRLMSDLHTLRGNDDASAAEQRDRHRRSLEADLLARHHRLYPQRKRWNMIWNMSWAKPLIACLAVLLVGVAACNAPTSYDVEMGKQMRLHFDDPAKSGDANDELIDQIEAMVAYVDGLPEVDNVLISINEIEGGPIDAELLIWGQNLDAEQLQQDLVAQFPALADAEISIEALTGSVEGNMGDMIGHALFDIEVEGETAEEIQAQIIAQLLEQGFEGDAVVDVQLEDGQTTINIELNDIEVDGDGEVMGETTDTIVIEQRTD
jgi:hypothetical protein